MELWSPGYLYVLFALAERSQRHQVGSAGQPVGLLFGRHDAQDLVHEAGHVRPRPPGASVLRVSS